MAKNVVVSLSGGMDSSTLLLRCLSEYDNVTALSFDYGQKHRVELERAQSLVDYLNANGQNIKYQVIKLDGLVNLLNSALVTGGEGSAHAGRPGRREAEQVAKPSKA